MIKEALEYLVTIGQAARNVKTLDLPGNRTLVVLPDGTQDIYDKDKSLRNNTIRTVASLILWCQQTEADELWVTDEKVLAIANPLEPDKRHAAVMPLTFTKGFALLNHLCDSPVAQKLFVRHLRGPLAGTLDEATAKVFRAIDFARINDARREVRHTGESLGRKVESQAQSAFGDIPEHLTFRLDVFQEFHSPAQVRVAVEVDAENERIVLLPIGDTIDDAQREAITLLKEDLDKALSGTPIYMG